MIYIKSVFCIDYQIIDSVTIREVKNQTRLSYWIDGEKFYDKKTQKLLRQIHKPDN